VRARRGAAWAAVLVALLALAGTAGPAAGPATADTQTAERAPVKRLRIFTDRTADRLEYERVLARSEGRTADAVDLTLRLAARIAQVWGAHQTILWSVYMEVVELWRGVGEHDRAIAALERMDADLAPQFWFDNYERATIRLTQARIFAQGARYADAERAFQAYFRLYADSDQPEGATHPSVYLAFSEVLARNGKAGDAAAFLARAEAPVR
jgi:tetratricopeptide (TPR) repeat protein